MLISVEQEGHVHAVALGPGDNFRAGQGVVLHVQQAGGGVADARHALGLRQGGQLFRVFDGQAGRLDDKHDAHGVGAGGDLRGLDLNPQFILSCQFDVAVALHKFNDPARIDGGLGAELQQGLRFAGVDLDDAQRLRGQAQAVRGQQRLRGFRQFAEAVDQFFLDVDKIVFGGG
ncbi:hypothetical protein G6F57_019655 [Rhizopus arrhizus]|nr:hypothetical protein G6F57_019655 [Rhizopus arrhizus]